MSPVPTAALAIPPHRIIPFRDWVKRGRRSPLSAETENTAARIMRFLEFHFRHAQGKAALKDISARGTGDETFMSPTIDNGLPSGPALLAHYRAGLAQTFARFG
ncbi:hypothetical protein GGR50DRAFT_691503 [Xylaria sp. CBS 124048]|nr:hypothetical protein GGR50DRAFT_691503 [Xylaria sp. CBS 124048]